ncbi:MAG: TrkH family potassium uptake protein [Saprospiraceae bacterium]
MQLILLQFPFRSVSLALGLVAIMVFIYDIGYEDTSSFAREIPLFYFLLLNSFIFFNVVRLLTLDQQTSRRSQRVMVIFFTGVLLFTLSKVLFSVASLNQVVLQYLVVFRLCAVLFFVIEYSVVIERFYSLKMEPAFIFAISFMLLIAIGTLLLMLPLANTKGISFVDALFTSTSAVCVTGLAVLDTGKDFTLVGQIIILSLIQAGGLGMLTITSFFAYFFKQNLSYRETLFVKDFVSGNHIGNIFRLLVNIVTLTFAIEILGAFFVFIFLPKEVFPEFGERVYFAVFHSISAFCNAGFSTLTNGLYESVVRYEYTVHLIIGFLIILGGFGYFILFNLADYIKERTLGFWKKNIVRSGKYRKRVRIVTLNSKIVIYTTLILLIVGTVFFFFAEQENALKEHPTFWGKLVTSFFGSVTPRTAGFNTVDYNALHIATIMITMLLMWIGASPGSTGGGIKTSTFAIATLTIFSTARGKDKLEISQRVVSNYSVRRAFAIINLSLIFIGFGVFFISAFEPNGKADFVRIAFECFSAYSTVGLSMSLTPILTDASKIVLVLLMFIGRVGAINLLISILTQIDTQHLNYPEEDILIN